jgi:hypothetical protein
MNSKIPANGWMAVRKCETEDHRNLQECKPYWENLLLLIQDFASMRLLFFENCIENRLDFVFDVNLE